MEQVYSAHSELVPTGTISMYITNSAPFGYLLCDGREVSRTSYRSLFNVIKTRFGPGNGETTFNLPDFRNRFPMGAGDVFDLTETGGSHTQTLVSNNLPHHLHGGTTNNGGYERSTMGGPEAGLGGLGTYPSYSNSHNHTFTTTVNQTFNQDGTVVQNTEFSILNKYLAIYYIIKY